MPCGSTSPTRARSFPAIAEVAEKAGGLDILVNNAAVFDAAPIVDITRDSYDRLYRINVAGTLFTLQAAALLEMIKQGRGGRIINMASQAGRRGRPWSRSIARPRRR